MGKWSLKEVAKAVNGTIPASEWLELSLEGAAFDTRNLKPGMLFIPLKGSRDGHDFIEEAIGKGAVAAFWSRPLSEAPENFPILQVEDPLAALQQWARRYLKEKNPKVVGITGSNGKTTTKDMTDAILSAKYRTYKTQGNFNNEIGLPMTILEMPAETEVLVLEMGMSAPGEIRFLSDLAEPDVAVITMIGESHIEFFGSREGIADAKMEIISGLKQNGFLVFQGDEPLLAERTAGILKSRKKTFGKSSLQDLYPLEIHSGIKETVFRVNQAPELELTLPVLGTYNVQNAMAALLVGEELGVPLQEGAVKLAHFHLTKNRLEWLDGLKDSHILNDAYNASPTSMKAVLRDFSNLTVKGRKRAVLGDIRELGDLSRTLHESVAEAISPKKLDEVILYGQEMQALNEKLGSVFPENHLSYFPETQKEDLIRYLENSTKKDDHILVKSSFGTGLLEVVEKLKANDHETD